MNRAETVIRRFGSQSALAKALGVGQSTVQYWCNAGRVPTRWHNKIVAAAKASGIHISPNELLFSSVTDHTETLIYDDSLPPPPNSPFAKWRGQIDLGGDPIDCYVLDTEQRVIALRSAIKAMAGVDSGNLGNYIGVTALKPFINSDLILGELIDFAIPGTQLRGSGMTTEHFELICRGYVQALYQGTAMTDRQREIAIKCAVITAGLTRTGLDALIDEATGYQYERAEDALQVKLRATIRQQLVLPLEGNDQGDTPLAYFHPCPQKKSRPEGGQKLLNLCCHL